jgi:hypothetical protein
LIVKNCKNELLVFIQILHPSTSPHLPHQSEWWYLQSISFFQTRADQNHNKVAINSLHYIQGLGFWCKGSSIHVQQWWWWWWCLTISVQASQSSFPRIRETLTRFL